MKLLAGEYNLQDAARGGAGRGLAQKYVVDKSAAAICRARVRSTNC